jgi:hypothetical protein
MILIFIFALNLSFPHQGRVPHISLVFREMWDTTGLSLSLSIHPRRLAVNIGGIPYLAKNERDTRDFMYAAPSDGHVCGFH